ncbi:MAG: ferritin [Bacilli bacterium]|nr:ferritin [Bacilli bacterium]
MNKELKDLIENQINKELWSAYIYYDMAEYYQSKGLSGFHALFEAHAKEEIEHAEKFCEFLAERGESFKMRAIEAPDKEYKDLREPLEYQVEHERLVTSLILKVYEKAKEVKDYIAEAFLVWYVNEQHEEETSAETELGQYDLYGKDGGLGLHMLDKEFAKKAAKE